MKEETRKRTLMRKTRKADECLLWTGQTRAGTTPSALTYGVAFYKGKRIAVHRLAFILWNGPIPKGKCVLHSCDRPLCVRPEHLSTGDQKENTRQCIERGRFLAKSFKAGSKHAQTNLSDEDVAEIRVSTLTRKELAAKHKLSVSQIGRIKTRARWKDGT